MAQIKIAFLALLAAFRALFINIGSETKAFFVNVWERVKTAVLHVILVPVHALTWAWGATVGSLRAAGSAFKAVWKK